MKKGILLLLCAALLGALLLGALFVHGKTQEAPIENAGTAPKCRREDKDPDLSGSGISPEDPFADRAAHRHGHSGKI